MPLVRFLRAVPVCGKLSLVVNSVGQSHFFREKGNSQLHPSTSADQSTGPHLVSLPLTTIEIVEKAKHLLTISYISLLGLYHKHVISTFNTYSRVPTPQCLTDTDGGYNLGGASFPHHTHRPFQPTVLRFSLMARLISDCQSQHKPLEIKSKAPSH
jgi:hypothetical protein